MYKRQYEVLQDETTIGVSDRRFVLKKEVV